SVGFRKESDAFFVCRRGMHAKGTTRSSLRDSAPLGPPGLARDMHGMKRRWWVSTRRGPRQG
ncbi:MAG: hypothetical protein J6C95_01745, partial [Muribaculaceae bacterium]|nr:hypothetical protein [Muribaculaceae bacterium]